MHGICMLLLMYRHFKLNVTEWTAVIMNEALPVGWKGSLMDFHNSRMGDLLLVLFCQHACQEHSALQHHGEMFKEMTILWAALVVHLVEHAPHELKAESWCGLCLSELGHFAACLFLSPFPVYLQLSYQVKAKKWQKIILKRENDHIRKSRVNKRQPLMAT